MVLIWTRAPATGSLKRALVNLPGKGGPSNESAAQEIIDSDIAVDAGAGGLVAIHPFRTLGFVGAASFGERYAAMDSSGARRKRNRGRAAISHACGEQDWRLLAADYFCDRRCVTSSSWGRRRGRIDSVLRGCFGLPIASRADTSGDAGCAMMISWRASRTVRSRRRLFITRIMCAWLSFIYPGIPRWKRCSVFRLRWLDLPRRMASLNATTRQLPGLCCY